MKKAFLSLLIAVFLSISGYSQETVTIGEETPTTSSNQIPLYPYYKNCYSQTLYTSAEIGTTGTITSLSYYLMTQSGASSNKSSQVKIYMALTQDSVLTTSSYIQESDLTLVYDGTLDFGTDAGLWKTIDLDTPFEVTDGYNLVIAVKGIVASYFQGPYWGTYSTTSKCIRSGSDSSMPITPSSYSVSSSPSIKLVLCDASSICLGAKNVQDSVIDAENVNVWWSEVEGSTGYQYQLKTSSAEWDSTGADIVDVSDTLVELTGLTGNTKYNIRIRNVCSTGSYSNWKEISFKTDCAFLTENDLPYTLDPTQEESGYGILPSCWTRLNTTNTSYPYLTTSGQICMSNSVSFALNGYTDDITMLQLSFLAYPSYNTASYGSIEIGVMTDLTDSTTFTSLKTIEATSYTSATWAKIEVPFTDYEAPDDAETYYAVVKHPSGYSWYLKDITLELAPDCLTAQAIKGDTITAETATISWTAGDETNDWTIYYWKDEDTDTLSVENIADTLVELTGLEAQTTYNFYIVTNCGDNSPKTLTYSFTTACSTIEVTDDAPFVADISYDGLYCWTDNEWSYYSYYGAVYTYEVSDLILPTLNIESVTTPYLKINHKNASTQLKLYYRASSNADWSDLYTLDATSDTITDIIALPNASAEYQIKMTPTSDSYAYIYSLEVYNEENPPSCSKAIGLAVNATSENAVVTWSQPDDASSWILYYKSDADDSYTATDELSDTTYTMDVEPQTTYTIYVATVCGSDASSYPTTTELTFTTPCVGLTLQDLPYTWDFDSNNVKVGTSSDKLPSCWQRIGSSYPYVYGYSTYAYSGDSLLYFSAYTTSYGILPFVDVENAPINTLQVSLYARNSSSYYDATLAIGVMTDPTDKSTFVVLDSVDLTGSYTLYEFPLSAYQGQGGYIAIRISSDDYAYVYVDDVTLQEIPACVKPQGLAASNITATTATITWSQGGEVTTWNLYYKSSEDEDYTQITNITETSYDLTLEDSKTYTVYVEAVCDNDSTIATNTITFKTLCFALTDADLPYTMDFENETTGDLPSCWTAIEKHTTTYGNVYPRVYSYSAYEGSKDFYMYYNNTVALKGYQGDISALQLSLMARPYSNTSSYGTLEVGVQTDLSDATTYQSVKVYNATDWVSAVYEKLTIPFDSIEADATTTYYVVLKHTEPYNSGYGWYLDNVKLEVIPSCAEATDVVISNVTSSSATVTWSQPDESDSWTVYYKANSDEDYQTIDASDTTAELTGLISQTTYIVYVQTNCTGDQPSTYPVSFKTECDENGITISDEYTYTQDFENTETNMVPDCWSKVTEAASGSTLTGANTYAKYAGDKSLVMKSSTACTQPMVALPKFTNSLSELRLKFYSKAESSLAGDLEIGYITDLTDTSTFVVLTSFPNTESSWTLHKIDFNTYEDQLENVTDARIAFRHNNPTVASSWYYYAVDDLEVLLVPACQEPNDITVSAESSSASITWTSNAASFNIVVKDENNAEIASESGYSTTQYDLTELTPNTTYTVSITGVCSDNSLTETTTATFTTSCVALTESDLPYETNFDSETSGTLPSCWIKVAGSSTTSPSVSSTYSYSGSYSFRINYNNTTASLQPYEGDISALRLTMYVRPSGTSSNYGSLQVGIQTDLSDTATYTAIAEMASTEWTSTTWKKKEIDFNTYTSDATTYYVILKYLNTTTSDYNSWYIDDVTLDNIPACPPAKDLQITSLSTDEATVSWSQKGEGVTSWIIKYREADSEDDTWQEETSVNADTTATLTGLTAATTYEVYIEGECSDAEEGNPTSDTITFTTSCSTITITSEDTYTQDFETGESGEAPLCWTKVVEGTASTYYLSGIGSFTSYEGSNALVLKASASCNQPMIALPEFTNSLSELRVKFYAKAESTTNSGDLELGYITDVTDSSTFVVLTSLPPVTTWTLHKIDLNAYDSILTGVTNARLAFRHNDPGVTSSWYHHSIDNLEVCLIPACGEPSDVTVDSITENGAVITWTSTSTTFNLTISEGENVVVTEDNLQAYTYTATNLDPSTTYTVSVKSVCDDGSITESSTATFTTLCGVEVVNNVTPWEPDLTSSDELICWTDNGAWSASSYYGGLYHSYSGSAPDDIYTPTLDISDVTAPAVTLTYSLEDYQSSGVVNYLTILYRANATDDWTELKTYDSVAIDAVDTIALPNKSATYQLNIRWSNSNSSADGITVSALKVFNNSTDTTTPAEPCAAPTSLVASNVTQTSATVSWSGTASSYDVQLNNNAAEMVNTTSKQFTGLTANTTYTVKVRSNCGTETSDWVSVTFTTLEDAPAPCNTPTDLEVVPTSNSLTLSWTGDAAAYDVQLNDQTIQTTSQTIFTFPNLTPSTTYSLKVRANCGETTSEWATTTGTTNAEATGDQDPVVTTNNATPGETTATLNAVVSVNNNTITASGFKYRLVDADAWTDVQATIEASGLMSATINGLTPKTTYEYKAYVTTDKGTFEGATKYFETQESGLMDVENTINVLTYPNPTTSNATLEVKGLTEDANVIVTDVNGRIVLRTVYTASDTSITIPTETLSVGVYYIKITNSTMTKTQTLIKK
jgi:trimeric autotransporter adhesin